MSDSRMIGAFAVRRITSALHMLIRKPKKGDRVLSDSSKDKPGV